MIKKKATMQTVMRPNIRGGVGVIKALNILEKNEMLGAFKYFSTMTFQPGESIGAHPHADDVEIYYILQGTFEVNEDGITSRLDAGDATITGNGGQHSIKNIGDTKAVLMAIIINQEV